MKLVILAVGKLKEPFFRAAQEEYLGRIARYASVSVREVADDAALVAAVPERAILALCDERGQSLTSEEWARRVIGAAETAGQNAPLCFVIGGADGLPAALMKRARHTLSFGRQTIAHRLARIVLLEQIYRGFTILRGEPYHHA